MPREVRDQVVAYLLKKKNGIIAGGTGSGKTTLMKAILDHVPASDRLIIIEQVAELRVLQPNALRWEAVDAIPGQTAVLPSALLAAALRHRPDRIIFGEIRDECANDLLQAMNTGHGGTLTTLHAKSAWGRAQQIVQSCAQCSTKYQSQFHSLRDRRGHRLRSLLRTRTKWPTESARADLRQWLRLRLTDLRHRRPLPR